MVFIADKGYYSESNTRELSENAITYIIPIKRCDRRIDYTTIDLSSMEGFDGFFSFHSRPIFYKTIRKAAIADNQESSDASE